MSGLDKIRPGLTRGLGGYAPWLHRFTLLTALATLGLIVIGGLVTSHGVGMAVPDWPNTYGYNMFAFPISKWVGGVLYEHSHRLMASLVGLLTAVLAIWLWLRGTEARPFTSAATAGSSGAFPAAEDNQIRRMLQNVRFRFVAAYRILSQPRWLGVWLIVLTLALMGIRVLAVYLILAALAPLVVGVCFYQIQHDSRPLRWWGLAALAMVILQGVLGGLRVVWFKDQIGIFHAALAQLFFVLVCLIALLTSRWWHFRTTQSQDQTASIQQRKDFRLVPSILPVALSVTTALIFLQLILGATMRHQHAGLAIPDFPLAYGKLWPALDPGSVASYNQQRIETVALNPITATQIALQMTHRLLAVAILAAVGFCFWKIRTSLGGRHFLSHWALAWLGLIVLQVCFGIATILSNKAADIATVHVLLGALSLALGTLLSVVSSRGWVLAGEHRPVDLPVPNLIRQPSAASLP